MFAQIIMADKFAYCLRVVELLFLIIFCSRGSVWLVNRTSSKNKGVSLPKYIVFLLFLSLIFACSKRSLDPVSTDDPNRLVRQYGSDNTFDIATWNVEQFPLQGRTTVAYLAQLIRDMDLDMIGMQEINDRGYFQALLDSLPDYAGFISDYPSDFLKLAVIYKKNMISISTPFQIFTDDWYAFPRPPLVTYVEVRDKDNVVFDFTLIINHFKALSGPENEDRRRDASEKLKIYIDSQILTSADMDCISLGDYNDRIDEPPAQNVFNVFLQDTVNYRFLTTPLLGEASYIGIENSLIDHLIISQASDEEYGGGETKILYLEKEFENYTTHISDHRPVLSKFPVF